MERLLERILPTPKKRIEAKGGNIAYVEPGKAPVELGKPTSSAIVEAVSIMTNAPVVVVDASGKETRSSKLYRAKRPLRRLRRRVCPRPLLTGEQFREYFT